MQMRNVLIFIDNAPQCRNRIENSVGRFTNLDLKWVNQWNDCNGKIERARAKETVNEIGRLQLYCILVLWWSFVSSWFFSCAQLQCIAIMKSRKYSDIRTENRMKPKKKVSVNRIDATTRIHRSWPSIWICYDV